MAARPSSPWGGYLAARSPRRIRNPMFNGPCFMCRRRFQFFQNCVLSKVRPARTLKWNPLFTKARSARTSKWKPGFQKHAPRTLFHVPCFMFHVPCFVSQVPCLMFHVFIPHAKCFMSHVSCCMFRVSCSTLHVPCLGPLPGQKGRDENGCLSPKHETVEYST